LFTDVPVGTAVRIVNQPVKLGRAGNDLFIEAHPVLPERLAEGASALTELTRAFAAFADEGTGANFDWDRAEEIASSPRGVPVFLSTNQSVVDSLQADVASRDPLTVTP
jgi:L,D-transpeptidase ErfK/SrfK